MNDLSKIFAECYSIQHLSACLELVIKDYAYIIAGNAPNVPLTVKESYEYMQKLQSETAKSLDAISENIANYLNNHDAVDRDEDFLVMHYFESKTPEICKQNNKEKTK